jgi:chromatin remodeling complex protein RSC6
VCAQVHHGAVLDAPLSKKARDACFLLWGVLPSASPGGLSGRAANVPSRGGDSKSMAAKKSPKKPAKKTASKRKPNAAFMKELTPSKELAEVVGAKNLPRTEVVKKLWAYIRKNGLQDSKEKRMINADDKLRAVFGGKKQVSMFEMTKLVNKHLA